MVFNFDGRAIWRSGQIALTSELKTVR